MIKIITKQELYQSSQDDFIILLNQVCDENDIKFDFHTTEKKLNDESKLFINDKWQKHLLNHSNAYNGYLMDINLIEIDKSHKTIRFAYDQTCYKYYISTKSVLYSRHVKNGNYFTNHLSCGVIIITSDNKIILGKVIYANSIKFVGGFFDYDKDIVDNQPSLSHCINREIQEEVGDINIVDSKIITIAYNVEHKFMILLLVANTNDSSFEIYKTYKNNRSKKLIDSELEDLLFIENNKISIQNFIDNNYDVLSPSTKLGLRIVIQTLI